MWLTILYGLIGVALIAISGMQEDRAAQRTRHKK